MSQFRVHAYTLRGNRVATIEVCARDILSARDKARAVLYRQGRQPNFFTLVPVEVSIRNPVLSK